MEAQGYLSTAVILRIPVSSAVGWQCLTTTDDVFSGYAAPASFDVTAAVTPGTNQLTLECVRLVQNELGTGGLLGPVVLYRLK